MTTKNWLIRTKNNHILGPVSKAKIIELVENESVKGDDELCSGNGHWFFVREEEYVKRYVHGNEVLSFNPVSEAKSVVAKPEEILTLADSPGQLPTDDDLDYPDIEECLSLSDDKTIKSKMTIVSDVDKTDKFEIDENLLAPKKTPMNFLNDKVILILAVLFLFLALYAFSQRKKILASLAWTPSFISNAAADPNVDIVSLEKKK